MNQNVSNPKATRQNACILLLLFLAACGSAPSPRPIPASNQKKPSTQGIIRVGDFLATPKNCGMTHYVRPVCPKAAKSAHALGEVKLSILVTKTGDVTEVQVLSGNPLLVPPAVEAVRQWRYAPCYLNSQPIEVKTVVVVPFTNQ